MARLIKEASTSTRVSDVQLWDHNGKKEDAYTYVYYLDPLRFEEFKAELDVGGEYLEAESRAYNRDWNQGRAFARWAVRSDGSFQLDLCKEDNATFGYRYIKIP